jgi:hypothetical protein
LKVFIRFPSESYCCWTVAHPSLVAICEVIVVALFSYYPSRQTRHFIPRSQLGSGSCFRSSPAKMRSGVRSGMRSVLQSGLQLERQRHLRMRRSKRHRRKFLFVLQPGGPARSRGRRSWTRSDCCFVQKRLCSRWSRTWSFSTPLCHPQS